MLERWNRLPESEHDDILAQCCAYAALVLIVGYVFTGAGPLKFTAGVLFIFSWLGLASALKHRRREWINKEFRDTT